MDGFEYDVEEYVDGENECSRCGEDLFDCPGKDGLCGLCIHLLDMEDD